MLFDLRHGKRRRFMQFLFGFLAIIFGASLVLVGAGSGGLLDAFSGGGGGNVDSAFEEPIEDAQKQTVQNPKSAAAWLALARADFSLANSASGTDGDTGQPNDKGEAAAAEGVEAWERYLKLEKRKPNAGAAQFAAQTYGLIGDANGAVKAQQIVVEVTPDPPIGWSQLALFAYASGNNALGDKAQAETLERTEKDQRNTVKSTLKEQEKQGKEYYKSVQAQKKAEKAEQETTKGQPSGQGFGPLPGQSGTGP